MHFALPKYIRYNVKTIFVCGFRTHIIMSRADYIDKKIRARRVYYNAREYCSPVVLYYAHLSHARSNTNDSYNGLSDERKKTRRRKCTGHEHVCPL